MREKYLCKKLGGGGGESLLKRCIFSGVFSDHILHCSSVPTVEQHKVLYCVKIHCNLSYAPRLAIFSILSTLLPVQLLHHAHVLCIHIFLPVVFSLFSCPEAEAESIRLHPKAAKGMLCTEWK